MDKTTRPEPVPKTKDVIAKTHPSPASTAVISPKSAVASSSTSAAASLGVSDEEKWDFTKSLREFAGREHRSDWRVNVLMLAIVAALTALAFGMLLATDLSAMAKFFGSTIIMMLSGEIMRGIMQWDGLLGLIMFKDNRTLGWIDRQAQRYANVWKMLSNVGMVMGYGLLSYFLLGKEERKPKRFALILLVGMPLLIIFLTQVAPLAFDVLKSAIGVKDLASASAQIRASSPVGGDLNFTIFGWLISMPMLTAILTVLTLIGGMAMFVWVSILFYAAGLVAPLINKIIFMALSLAGRTPAVPVIAPIPGGTPILPGVNLPLVEGLIAMAILLVVHEMSHGFLARVHKIKLENAGIVFYGILPFGAFVEPDEKQLDKVPQEQSNQVLVAGSAANMITAMIVLVLIVALGALVVIPYANWAAAQEFAKGSWQAVCVAGSVIILKFIETCLELTLALNILVGMVNLLPVPLFDGHRLMKAGVKHPLAVDAITYVTLAAFVINFLPWLFR